MAMEMQITKKGRLATIECARCRQTATWHEWADEGQAEDLKDRNCQDCGGMMDKETFWYSPSRNWYAGRYSMPGYLDCTEWHYGKNLRKLEKELRDFYGN